MACQFGANQAEVIIPVKLGEISKLSRRAFAGANRYQLSGAAADHKLPVLGVVDGASTVSELPALNQMLFGNRPQCKLVIQRKTAQRLATVIECNAGDIVVSHRQWTLTVQRAQRAAAAVVVKQWLG